LNCKRQYNSECLTGRKRGRESIDIDEHFPPRPLPKNYEGGVAKVGNKK